MTEASQATWAADEARRGYWGQVARRFLKHRPAVAGLAFLLVMAAAITLGPQFLPYGYDDQDLDLIGSPGGMSWGHWLGSDELGRDAATRLLYGGRVSLA